MGFEDHDIEHVAIWRVIMTGCFIFFAAGGLCLISGWWLTFREPQRKCEEKDAFCAGLCAAYGKHGSTIPGLEDSNGKPTCGCWD
jgi:hypothetical protein